MMRVLWSSTTLALLCSACVAAPPPPPVMPVAPVALSPAVSGFQTKVSETDPNCNDYTGQAMIDGKEEQVVGHACKQADGSWKVAEGTASQPNQFTAVYPAPVYPDGYYYPDYFYGDPWLWDASFGFGTSFVFFGNHFHHHGFHRGGFHHGGSFHGGGGFHHR
jgi:hypothetical protein